MDCLLVEEQQHISSEVGCQGRKTEEACSAKEVEDLEDHQQQERCQDLEDQHHLQGSSWEVLGEEAQEKSNCIKV